MASNQVYLEVSGIDTEEDARKIQNNVEALHNVFWCIAEKGENNIIVKGENTLTNRDVAVAVLLAGDYKVLDPY